MRNIIDTTDNRTEYWQADCTVLRLVMTLSRVERQNKFVVNEFNTKVLIFSSFMRFSVPFNQFDFTNFCVFTQTYLLPSQLVYSKTILFDLFSWNCNLTILPCHSRAPPSPPPLARPYFENTYTTFRFYPIDPVKPTQSLDLLTCSSRWPFVFRFFCVWRSYSGFACIWQTV